MIILPIHQIIITFSGVARVYDTGTVSSAPYTLALALSPLSPVTVAGVVKCAHTRSLLVAFYFVPPANGGLPNTAHHSGLRINASSTRDGTAAATSVDVYVVVCSVFDAAMWVARTPCHCLPNN